MNVAFLSSLLLEAQNFSILGGQPVDHLRLLRFHVQHFLSLSLLVRRRPGDESGSLPAILLPQTLSLGRRQKNGEERAFTTADLDKDGKARVQLANLTAAFYQLSQGQRVSIDVSKPGAM